MEHTLKKTRIFTFFKKNILNIFLLFLYLFVLIRIIDNTMVDGNLSSFQKWKDFSTFVSKKEIFYKVPVHIEKQNHLLNFIPLFVPIKHIVHAQKKVFPEYPHLPIMYILMYPFHQMSSVLGAILWMTLKFLMVIVICGVALSYIKDSNIYFPPWLLAIILCLNFRYFSTDLANGNIDLLVGGVIALSLHFLRKNNQISCGLLIGLASVLKITPFLFIPYFFIKRMWKSFIFSVISILIFVLLPSVFIGWQYNIKLCQGYYHQMLEPFIHTAKITATNSPPQQKQQEEKQQQQEEKKQQQQSNSMTRNIARGYKNQSLSAVLIRICTNTPVFFRSSKTSKNKLYINILNWQKRTVLKISKILSLMLFILIISFCRTNKNDYRNIGFLGEFVLIFLATLCISDRTWKIHSTLLIFAHTFLCVQLLTIPKKKYFPIIILITNLLLYLASASFIVGKYYSHIAEAYGVHLFIYLLLIFGCIYSISVFARNRLAHDNMGFNQ